MIVFKLYLISGINAVRQEGNGCSKMNKDTCKTHDGRGKGYSVYTFGFLTANIGRGWCLGRRVVPSIRPFCHSTAILYVTFGSKRYKTR